MTGTNRAAALTAVYRTRVDDDTPADDARELLDKLGLLGPPLSCARHLRAHPAVPADPGEKASAALAPINGGDGGDRPSKGRMGATVYAPPPLGGRLCPPGLRALFEGGEPVGGPAVPPTPVVEPPAPPPPPRTPRTPKPPPKPPRVRAPKPPKPPRVRAPKPPKPPKVPAPPAPIEHGTEKGWRTEGRRDLPHCEPCREARRLAENARRQSRYRPRPRKVAACGTPAGYKKHLREDTDVCTGCRDARRADNAKYSKAVYARRKAARAA